MKVVGITSQQEVYIGSRERNFRINEFLIIEDDVQGDIIGEIVEARTYNRYIPLNLGGDFVDSSVLESLRALGYDVDDETIYIAKLRLFNEALYPVLTGSDVRVPKFHEIKDFLLTTEADEGFVLGVIRNTDDLYEDMEDKYKGLVETFEEGKILSQKEVPYIMDIKSMHQYPHIGIFGGSGSGKSFGLRVMLEEIMEKNIPAIVLDPHYEMDFAKADNSFNKDYSQGFKILEIGVDTGIKFENLSLGDIKNLLNAASTITDAMINVVNNMFVRGNSYNSFMSKMLYLIEAQEEGGGDRIQMKIDYAESPEERQEWEKKKEIWQKYDKQCNNASVRGVVWRLQRLQNEGIFQKDINEIIDAFMNNRLVVVQGSIEIIRVFSTYLLSKLYHDRRNYKDAHNKKQAADYFPPFIIVTDEAHNFAPKGYEIPTKKTLKEIAQEGRKYGVFLILATQRPTLLDETITAQLNTKFIFRTVRASDIDTIREETDITSEDAKRLPYLRTGDTFISSSQRGRTSFARIRAAHTTGPHSENPFEELKNKNMEEDTEFLKNVRDFFPINPTTDILNIQRELANNYGKNYSLDYIHEKFKTLVEKGIIEVKENFLGEEYILKE